MHIRLAKSLDFRFGSFKVTVCFCMRQSKILRGTKMFGNFRPDFGPYSRAFIVLKLCSNKGHYRLWYKCFIHPLFILHCIKNVVVKNVQLKLQKLLVNLDLQGQILIVVKLNRRTLTVLQHGNKKETATQYHYIHHQALKLN